jgi:hypothetical protein
MHLYYPCFAYSEKDETLEIAIESVDRNDLEANPFSTEDKDKVHEEKY